MRQHLYGLAVLYAFIWAPTRHSPPPVGSPLPSQDIAPVPQQTCADTIPHWLRAVMTDLVAGSGRWIADNTAYRGTNEPYDEYGLEWRWGLGRQTVRGRLFGLQSGREVGDFWEFRLMWHPGDCQALLYQFGSGGALGVGPMAPDGNGGTVLDQIFYYPGGQSERVRHESRVIGDEERGSSFNWVDGEWQKRRTYTWRRVT
jgi:hypothetical protein